LIISLDHFSALTPYLRTGSQAAIADHGTIPGLPFLIV